MLSYISTVHDRNVNWSFCFTEMFTLILQIRISSKCLKCCSHLLYSYFIGKIFIFYSVFYELLRGKDKISKRHFGFVSFHFSQFFFTCYKAQLFGTYILMIVVSSWWTNPIISLKHSILFLVMLLSLKSNLASINIVPPAFCASFLCIFLSFTFKW